MRYLIVLLALAGLIDSVMALRIHMEDPNAAPPCAVTERWDCGTVNHSRFSVFPPTSFDDAPNSRAVHIPVAILGIVGYGLIAVFAFLNRLWIALQLTEIGFAFAAFLTYMEEYIIQKWCIYCVWSQIIISVILALIAVTLVLEHRKKRSVRQPVTETVSV